MVNPESRCANCKNLKRFAAGGEDFARCLVMGLKWGKGQFHKPISSCDEFKPKNLTREVAGGIYGLLKKLGAKG